MELPTALAARLVFDTDMRERSAVSSRVKSSVVGPLDRYDQPYLCSIRQRGCPRMVA